MENRVEDFVWKDIVCRFGIPANIITDNGPQFQDKFNKYCSNQHIKHNPISVQTPQSNGQAEAMIKKILRGMKRKIVQAQSSWLEELPGILFSL